MEELIQQVEAMPTFEGLPREQIEWLIGKTERNQIKEGEDLFRTDDPMEYLFIVLSGYLIIRVPHLDPNKVFSDFREGGVTGALPYSRGKKALGTGTMQKDGEILTLHRKHFREMIQKHYELTERLVHLMNNRVRSFTQTQQFNEKLVALGKMSAGLAHELNNPSAAVVRSASELTKHQQTVPDDFKKVINIQVSEEQVDAVNEIVFSKARAPKPQLSLMDLSDLEDEIMDWLDEHEVDEADEMASTFTEFGLGLDELQEIQSNVPRPIDLGPVLKWCNSVLTTEKLVGEIELASQRISNLVSSIKSYTHMDKSPDRQKADIHEGLENTLTILNHKIKKNKINLVKDFQKSLPPVPMYVGELNQVWTNLIDNALDAMPENGGALELKTWQEGDFVKTIVRDNGAGIPEEHLSKIFDPFFTTKEVGKGTGLGLDIVYRIIKKHNADIKVNSKPGETEFIICLPLEG